MADELKFSTIVERAMLDKQTAQYVLKHPELLTGMPIAGTQGVHRRFSLRQAVRFAICTHLVSAGVQLTYAGPVVDEVEYIMKVLNPRATKKGRLYQGDANGPWILEVVNVEQFRVCKEGVNHPHFDDREFMSVKNVKDKTTEADAGAVTRLEIDLTVIEARLANA